MKLKTRLTTATLASAIALAGTPPTMAASHSDAPLIKQDPQANITDVYAFIGKRYDDPEEEVLNVIVHVRPFSEPGDGVIYDRFADDARYSIHIADPNTGETQLRYDFEFSQVSASPSRFGEGGEYKNRDTILSYGLGTEVGPIIDVGDNRQNYVQTYSVSCTESHAGRKTKTQRIGEGLLTPPPNVGLRTTPAYNDPTTGRAVSGATQVAELDTYTRQTVFPLPNGEVVFAGPREDGFFADTPGIATLINTVFGLSLADSGRSDLSLVYIPDVLRVDTTTGPVALAGQSSFDRLGFIGGDVATAGDSKVKSSGWPNGRRLGDDVVDIALTAVASGPIYSTVTLVGDNIAANDQVYHQVFPYSATPHAGPTNRKDP